MKTPLNLFVIWTMGSLGEVTGPQLAILAAAVSAGLLVAIATIKPLDILLLGEQYARTMGLNLRRSRMIIILSTHSALPAQSLLSAAPSAS